MKRAFEGASKIRRALLRARSAVSGRVEGGAGVLMYHRVADTPFDPWSLSVSPRRFERHIRAVKESFSPVTLADMRRGMEEENLPEDAVAVTFDDGYSDNLFAAKPILEEHGVPATVFVASGYIGGEREFWWDELERIVSVPTTLPASLDAGFERVGAGSGSKRSRMKAYFALWETLRFLPDDERKEALARLREQVGDDGEPRSTHRPMTASELREISGGGLVEIGGHTATHPELSTLSREEQRAEIQAGKSTVEAALGYPITSFSYPHGNFGPETVEEVRDAGYDVACTSESRLVAGGESLFELPRIFVTNSGGWSARGFQL